MSMSTFFSVSYIIIHTGTVNSQLEAVGLQNFGPVEGLDNHHENISIAKKKVSHMLGSTSIAIKW